jgi:hypothetical protein
MGGTPTSGLHRASPHTQAIIMNNGFTALLMVLGIAVSARAYAQDGAPLLKAQVFPEPLCENLLEVRPELTRAGLPVDERQPEGVQACAISDSADWPFRHTLDLP